MKIKRYFYTNGNIKLSVFILIQVSLVLPKVDSADLVNFGGNPYEEKSEILIEPTPVLIRRTPRSTYKMGLPRIPPPDQGSWYEGSGRGKKPYSLEDFLVWMPSGDGPPEQWYYSKDYDWKQHYTKTVYVTSTKYETVIVPQYIAAAPTDAYPQIASTDVLQLGKDIQGSIKTEIVHECKVYHVLRPVYSGGTDLNKPQNDQSASSNVDSVHSHGDLDKHNVDSDKKFSSSDINVQKDNDVDQHIQDLGPDLKPSSADNLPVTSILETPTISYDATDLIHPSIEYLGPSSILETPYINLITPTLKSINEKSSLDVSVFISSYYDMRSYNIDSTNIHYSFPTVPPVPFLTSFYSFTYTNDASVYPTVSSYSDDVTHKQDFDSVTTKIPKFLTTSKFEMPTTYGSAIYLNSNNSGFDIPTDITLLLNDSTSYTPETFLPDYIYTFQPLGENKSIPVTKSSYNNETFSLSTENQVTELLKTISVSSTEDYSIGDGDESASTTLMTENPQIITAIDSATDTTVTTQDLFSMYPTIIPVSSQSAAITTTISSDSISDHIGTRTTDSFTDVVNSTEYISLKTEHGVVSVPTTMEDQSSDFVTFISPDSITATSKLPSDIFQPNQYTKPTTLPTDEISTVSLEISKDVTTLSGNTTVGTDFSFIDVINTTLKSLNGKVYTTQHTQKTPSFTSSIIISSILPSTFESTASTFLYDTTPAILDKDPSLPKTLAYDEESKIYRTTSKPFGDHTDEGIIASDSFFDIFGLTAYPTDSEHSDKQTISTIFTPSRITPSTINADTSTFPIPTTSETITTSIDLNTSMSTVHPEVPCNCDELNATRKTGNNITITKISSDLNATTDPQFPFKVQPSPSNNITVPVDQKYWLRTILYGYPDEENQIFKSKIHGKLNKLYKTAYRRQYDKENTNDTSPKKQIKKQEEQQRKRRESSLFPNVKYLDKFNIKFIRAKRQAEPKIDVRIQNITYFNTTNITELIYSVFEDDAPVLAIKAVTVMENINYTEAEELLGYPLQIKAQEYLQPSWEEANSKAYLFQLFALLAGISGIVFLTVFAVFCIYKRYKKRSTFESSRDLRDGSEASSPRGQVDAGIGSENLGYHDSHDEESTPEEGNSARISPDVEDDGPFGRPSSSKPSSTSSRRRKGEEEHSPYSARSGKDYATIENEKKASDSRNQPMSEPLYSTPKSIPLSQRQSNIELALQQARFKLAPNLQIAPFGSKEFIPGTSLPKFLPPPKTHFPLFPSPEKPSLPQRNYSLDETLWPKPDEEMDVLPSQVEETVKEGSLAPISRASSDIEISTENSGGGGIGLGRLRRRFHDLLDDAFSLMHGQRPTDKVTHISTPYHTRRVRTRSAMPGERSNILDELEDQGQLSASAKPMSQPSRRPWSAAASYYASEPLSHHTGSLEVSPRSAWGDQRGCITPVNLPHPQSEGRPDSAPMGRSSSISMRSPTPVDYETGLRVGDPALPLIKAIKDELHRFKSTVNKDSSDA